MITSRDNPKAKWMRSLLDARDRRREGCFLAEGVILVAEALRAGIEPRLVFYDGAALQTSERGRRLLEDLAGRHAQEVIEQVLASVCDTVTPQGVVAALPIPHAPVSLPPDGLVVVLDGLHDPGNVGAILRSADAAGCAAVIAMAGTADLYAPKVARAAMGAHLHLVLVPDVSWAVLCDVLGGRKIYVAEADGELVYDSVNWTEPAALVIGNETGGARPEAQRCATGRVSIPMPGRAESLNAGVAASIIIFEAVRQQRARLRDLAG